MFEPKTWLQLAFVAGAITDAIAALPMLFSPLADIIWGFSSFTGEYQFAMELGASLMIGWTLLLLWAFKRPLERRFVAPLTLVVIAGITLAEIHGLLRDVLTVSHVAPTWLLKAVLILLFSYGYWITKKQQ
jgi:hypothetical protein